MNPISQGWMSLTFEGASVADIVAELNASDVLDCFTEEQVIKHFGIKVSDE